MRNEHQLPRLGKMKNYLLSRHGFDGPRGIEQHSLDAFSSQWFSAGSCPTRSSRKRERLKNVILRGRSFVSLGSRISRGSMLGGSISAAGRPAGFADLFFMILAAPPSVSFSFSRLRKKEIPSIVCSDTSGQFRSVFAVP